MTADPLHEASWRWLGRVPFSVGLQANLDDLQALRPSLGLPGTHPRGRLVLFEPAAPVFTLGRRAATATGRLQAAGTLRLCAARGIEVVPVDRGGLGTLHLPGQVVVLLAVPCDRTGLRDLVCRLLQAARRTALAWGVDATCDTADNVGLWVASGTGPAGKLASIGLHEAGGLTGHGLALNAAVDVDLTAGLSLCGSVSTRYASLGPAATIQVPAVAARLARELGLPADPVTSQPTCR